MKSNPEVRLHRSNARHGAAQLLGVGICSAVLFLFVALSYSEIVLPRYTTSYAQKDTQQVVNLLITVVATAIGILLSHCRRLTNEAETKIELRNGKLTIPRLQVHYEAAARLGIPFLKDREVWGLVMFYFLAMVIFAFMHSVLSVIFVIESVISNQGEQSPAYIPIGIDIPDIWHGRNIDACSSQIAAPGCSYDLALTALSSGLVTYTDYTVGGVTFNPKNGTMGMPYYAMQHFTDLVGTSTFEEERRQYCLPVMDPNLLTCEEAPFLPNRPETVNGFTSNTTLVKYQPLDVSHKDDAGNVIKYLDSEIYEIAIPSPTTYDSLKYRTRDQGQGTFLVRMYPEVAYEYTTVITASDCPPGTSTIAGAGGCAGGGYASLLYYLMHGVDPDPVTMPKNSTFYFAAKCKMASIWLQDNYRSSWRKVDFTWRNGVSRANVTEERCANARGNWSSGFIDNVFDIEGAAAVTGSSDGYSKLFNRNQDNSKGTDIFANMSRLDAIVNKMIHLTSTAWTQENYQYAMKNQTVYENPIMMTNFPHLYVIRISWTPTTYIGLVLSLLITLNAWVLAGRWVLATQRFGTKGAETWNLLRPIDLMAYSLAAYNDLIYDLSSYEHRRMTMRGKVRTVLREYPTDYDFTSSNALKSPVSDTAESSPTSVLASKA